MGSHHDQVMLEIENDESICVECGGWLGRKPGSKPHCSRFDCPGRFAPIGSPMSRATTAPALSTSPLAKHFPNSQKDDLEMRRIKVHATAARIAELSPAADFSLRSPDWPRLLLAILVLLPLVIIPAMVTWIGLSPDARWYSLEGILVFAAVIGLIVAGWRTSRRLGKRIIGMAFMLLSIFALLLNLVIPMLPPIGEQRAWELCVGLGQDGPTLRFDRALVDVGPCWRFDVSFVDRRRSTAAPPPPPPGASQTAQIYASSRYATRGFGS